MIRNIKIINYKNEEVTIDINSSYSSGFNIRQIDGLGPVKANIVTTKNVTSDGDIYNSARADKRNIVLTLGFDIRTNLGLNMIEDVRHKSYQFFPLKSLVKINIETDKRTLYTYGYVESNEPNIFSNDETAQISVICPDSYFTSENERNFSLDQIKPLFKFPFEVRADDLESVNIMEQDKDYSVQVILERENLNKSNNGNINFGLYRYLTLYMDIMPLTYEELQNYSYESMKYIK